AQKEGLQLLAPGLRGQRLVATSASNQGCAHGSPRDGTGGGRALSFAGTSSGDFRLGRGKLMHQSCFLLREADRITQHVGSMSHLLVPEAYGQTVSFLSRLAFDVGGS